MPYSYFFVLDAFACDSHSSWYIELYTPRNGKTTISIIPLPSKIVRAHVLTIHVDDSQRYLLHRVVMNAHLHIALVREARLSHIFSIPKYIYFVVIEGR